jgi:serine/threonine protein kinase
MSESVRDLIAKLLDKDKTKRLGANGAEEVLEHPWFSDINTTQLLGK